MSNILQGAKFGDTFRTRSGQLAIYIDKTDSPSPFNVFVILEGMRWAIMYREDGRKYSERTHELDIVRKISGEPVQLTLF